MLAIPRMVPIMMIPNRVPIPPWMRMEVMGAGIPMLIHGRMVIMGDPWMIHSRMVDPWMIHSRMVGMNVVRILVPNLMGKMKIVIAKPRIHIRL